LRCCARSRIPSIKKIFRNKKRKMRKTRKEFLSLKPKFPRRQRKKSSSKSTNLPASSRKFKLLKRAKKQTTLASLRG